LLHVSFVVVECLALAHLARLLGREARAARENQWRLQQNVDLLQRTVGLITQSVANIETGGKLVGATGQTIGQLVAAMAPRAPTAPRAARRSKMRQ
jgi:hypothetical protein